MKTPLPLLEPSEPRPPRGGGSGSLAASLAERTTDGLLYEARGPHIVCTACAHRCVLAEGRAGACGVRFVRDGSVRAPFGYVARKYVRSVETNTIYHVRPGSRALTFGMFGCDLKCPYCHNHVVSQALRDGIDDDAPFDVTADALADEAVQEGCDVVCAAYNEPMISAEWARAVFTAARARGMLTALISDGHTTPEALAYMRPVTDVFRVDVKGDSQEHYRSLGGRLEPVLEGIGEALRLGYWVEVVTLVVPGFNDDPSGLRALAKKLVALSPDIPWHLNAFYPRYKLTHLPRTSALPLVSAAGTAYALGLKFVYVSNIDDELGELTHTRCPKCTEVVVRRVDYRATDIALEAGACRSCGTALAGLW